MHASRTTSAPTATPRTRLCGATASSRAKSCTCATLAVCATRSTNTAPTATRCTTTPRPTCMIGPSASNVTIGPTDSASTMPASTPDFLAPTNASAASDFSPIATNSQHPEIESTQLCPSLRCVSSTPQVVSSLHPHPHPHHSAHYPENPTILPRGAPLTLLGPFGGGRTPMCMLLSASVLYFYLLLVPCCPLQCSWRALDTVADCF